MCFPFDAIVPELPAGFRVIAGGAAGELVTLTSADGTDFSAYLAHADGPTGVVVLPDVRGLFRFYEQLAERFAAAGHPAIAIDYFGRTAGLGPRDEDFEYRPHVQQTTPGPRTSAAPANAAEKRVPSGDSSSSSSAAAPPANGAIARSAGRSGGRASKSKHMPGIVALPEREGISRRTSG